MPEPCKICGASVRVRRQPEPTLADPNDYYEIRTCNNRSCETNDPYPTMATPTP